MQTQNPILESSWGRLRRISLAVVISEDTRTTNEAFYREEIKKETDLVTWSTVPSLSNALDTLSDLSKNILQLSRVINKYTQSNGV